MVTAEPSPMAQDPLPTPKQLITSFSTFANNNRDFRTGLIDEIELSITEGERVDDSEDPDNHIKLSYEFEARRYRFPRARQPRFTAFELSLITTKEGVELPAYIAVETYGLEDPEEAVQEAGPCKLEHRLSFSIGTLEHMLTACESCTYTDEDGDIINSVCSCDLVAPAWAQEDEDEDADEDDYGAGDPFSGPLIEHEQVSDQTPEEADELWAMLQTLEPSVSKEPNDPEWLQTASFVFASMRKALARQLGVQLGEGIGK